MAFQIHINVIPTGLELDKFSIANKNQEMMNDIIHQYHLQNKFVVTFLGRVAPEKSIDLLIEAMYEIVQYKKIFV